MGPEGEEGRQLTPEERTNEVWKDLFLKELTVSSRLYPFLRMVTYEHALPWNKVSIITRAYRDGPYEPAHTITVAAYQRGRLMKYASGITTYDVEGRLMPHVVSKAVRGEVPSSAEMLGSASLNKLKRISGEL